MRSQNRRLSGIVVALGLALTLLAGWGTAPARSASSKVLITAVYHDTYLTDEPDEAFRLMNVGSTAAVIRGLGGFLQGADVSQSCRVPCPTGAAIPIASGVAHRAWRGRSRGRCVAAQYQRKKHLVRFPVVPENVCQVDVRVVRLHQDGELAVVPGKAPQSRSW